MRRESRRRLLSLDPNVRPGLVADRDAYLQRLEGLVRLADLVKVSRADLAWLYPGQAPEAVASRWLGFGPALVLVTRGKDGATALGVAAQPAYEVTPVRLQASTLLPADVMRGRTRRRG